MDMLTTAEAADEKKSEIDKMLDDLNAQIADFEAKKLGQLKSELEAFNKKKKSLVDSYTAKYPGLLKQWTDQNALIRQMHKTLVCRFEDWREKFQHCVCDTIKYIDDAQADLDIRLNCAKLKLEADRDAAQNKADITEAYLKALSDNEKGVAAALSANNTRIGDVGQLLNGAGSHVAIYVFWGKLLPSHKQLAPEPLAPDLEKSLAAASCSGPSANTDAAGSSTPHAAPWLVDPDEYGAKLDAAWSAHKKAKEDYGAAAATFAKAPNDVVTVAKAIEAKRKRLDADIRECLKAYDVEAKAVTATPSSKSPSPDAATPSDTPVTADNDTSTSS